MTEGSVYSKRWRLWDAIMLYARGVMYIVLTVLAVTEYFYVNRLLEQGVSFSQKVWTPVLCVLPYVTVILIVVCLFSLAVLFPVETVLARRGVRWLGCYEITLPAVFIATVGHFTVFTLAASVYWPAYGIAVCIVLLIWPMFIETTRGITLSAEALTRDRERPTKSAQEPSSD